jgi:hypothetical protein
MKQIPFRNDPIEPFPDRSGNLTRRAAGEWLEIAASMAARGSASRPACLNVDSAALHNHPLVS